MISTSPKRLRTTAWTINKNKKSQKAEGGKGRNFSASALGVNEEFGSKEMTLAYSKLLTIDNKFTDEFNMIDRLNQMYRMANMDISSMAKKIQTDFVVFDDAGHCAVRLCFCVGLSV